MEGVTTTVGSAPIPSSGGGFGRFGRFGSPVSFAGSSELVSLVKEGLIRLQGAIDVANEACSSKQSLDFWTGAQTLNWILGNNTSTASICSAAAQMQVGYDYYAEKADDPNTTDDELTQIIASIHKYVDVSDLMATAEATGGAAAFNLALQAPGALVDAAGNVVGDIGKGIIAAIPWWAWVGGGVFLAVKLGWLDSKTFARKR